MSAEAAAPLHVDGNHRRWEVSRYTTQADYPVVKVDAYFLDDEASVYQDDYEGDYEGSFDVPVADLPALIEALVKAAVAS